MKAKKTIKMKPVKRQAIKKGKSTGSGLELLKLADKVDLQRYATEEPLNQGSILKVLEHIGANIKENTSEQGQNEINLQLKRIADAMMTFHPTDEECLRCNGRHCRFYGQASGEKI